ncbi:hypothetical protein PSL68_17915, partial [Clostridioides difficile]|uniref:DUF5724 domain-containing protein n=1 Tax=Clostridioides difficile TaxID=1496 RepID=UPI00235905E7
ESLKHTLENLNSKTKSFSGSVFPWTWIEISSHEILKKSVELSLYYLNKLLNLDNTKSQNFKNRAI